MKKYIITLSTLLCASAAHGAASQPPKKPSDLFAELSKKAEAGYQKSGAEKMGAPEQPAAPAATVVPEPVAPKKEEKAWSFLDYFRSESAPIVAKHKEFSPDWWKELFGSCKGCTDPEKKIDCKKMLTDNPQWKEVEGMSTAGKKVVMKRVLDRYARYVSDIDPCILACALCAGGNPDERLEYDPNDAYPHTLLHLTAEYRRNYALFSLALEKGADPHLKCAPTNPNSFIPSQFIEYSEWRDRLKKYGAKKTND